MDAVTKVLAFLVTYSRAASPLHELRQNHVDFLSRLGAFDTGCIFLLKIAMWIDCHARNQPSEGKSKITNLGETFFHLLTYLFEVPALAEAPVTVSSDLLQSDNAQIY